MSPYYIVPNLVFNGYTQKQMTSTLRTLRVELSTLREELADLKEAHSTLKRSTAQTINSQKSHVLEITHQAAVFEEELASAKQLADEHERTVHALRAQLEELSIEKHDEGRWRTEDENWQVVRDELHRQASYMRNLETTNARLTGEVTSLKERQMSVEVLREEKRDLERKARAADGLRDQVARLEAEVQAGRREREQWARETQNGDGPGRAPAVGMSQTVTSLRMTNALLQEEHGATAALLRRRESELADAERRDAEARKRVIQLEEDAKELKHHGARRERRLDIAEREVGFLKALVASFTAEEPSVSDQEEAKLGRIQNLEEAVEELKGVNAELEKEVDTLGGGVRHGTSWSELTRTLQHEQARREELEQGLYSNL